MSSTAFLLRGRHTFRDNDFERPTLLAEGTAPWSRTLHSGVRTGHLRAAPNSSLTSFIAASRSTDSPLRTAAESQTALSATPSSAPRPARTEGHSPWASISMHGWASSASNHPLPQPMHPPCASGSPHLATTRTHCSVSAIGWRLRLARSTRRQAVDGGARLQAQLLGADAESSGAALPAALQHPPQLRDVDADVRHDAGVLRSPTGALRRHAAEHLRSLAGRGAQHPGDGPAGSVASTRFIPGFIPQQAPRAGRATLSAEGREGILLRYGEKHAPWIYPKHSFPKRKLLIWPRFSGMADGVADGTRTHDDQNHNLGLYQLSYSHRREAKL